MKIRASLMVFLGLSLMFVTHSTAQQLSGPGGASFDPCPGGAVNAQIDTESPPSLESMVQTSELIIVGRVANILPAVLNNPDFLYVTETPSLIAIREVLHGTLPPNTNAILLNQLGGQVGRCKMVVDADPLVKLNEEYVLFLRADRRTYPSNTSGSPRYSVVGDWSGKAKIVNGKIEFLSAANKRLHQYDNSDAIAFIELVKQRIGKIFPKK